MLLGLRAAAWGSLHPTRIGLGTDVVTRNPDLKLVDSPTMTKRGWRCRHLISMWPSFTRPALMSGVSVKSPVRITTWMTGLPEHRHTRLSQSMKWWIPYFNDPDVARRV